MRNKQLLERVADAIEREPGRYNQRAWISEWEERPDQTLWTNLGVAASRRSARICDSAFCIAGWASALWSLDEGVERMLINRILNGQGMELLGLTREEAVYVFYGGQYPDSEYAHKEVAEWLRGIARGDDVFKTAPEWWESDE